MNKIFILLLLTILLGCGEPLPPVYNYNISYAPFFQSLQQPSIGGQYICESNLYIYQNNAMINYGDLNTNTVRTTYAFGVTYPAGMVVCDIYCRFPYIVEHDGVYYMFGCRDWAAGSSSIYIWESSNAISWTAINGGNPVIEQSSDPASIWNRIWNVAVCWNDAGKVIIYAECAAAGDYNENVGLALATADFADDTFSNIVLSETQTIIRAGNPDIKHLSGDRFILIYGHQAPTGGNPWSIRAAKSTDGITWIESANINIGQSGLDICDPSIIEQNGKIYLTLSYDQKVICMGVCEWTLDQLFENM